MVLKGFGEGIKVHNPIKRTRVLPLKEAVSTEEVMRTGTHKIEFLIHMAGVKD